jgi:gamma-glutamyltranspeptidase/glutathione hydrolase
MRVWLSTILFLAQTAWAAPVEGQRIMISAATSAAVDCGREIALQGGNVADAAVAVELCLAVTAPYYASLGGGGLAMIKMKDQGAIALDFREVAPAETGKNYFVGHDQKMSIEGGTAVAVPGVAAGLWALHQKFGHLKWKSLFAPALHLARDGFRVSGEFAERTRHERASLEKYGNGHFRSSFKPGDLFKQPLLTKALILLRERGPDGFYTGEVAADLVHAVKASGGVLNADDLLKYKVRWLKPLTTEFEGHTLDLMPPPSSGGVVVFTGLRLMDKLRLKDTNALSTDEAHMLAEIEARAFRGRAQLGDPDFHKNPIAELTSDAYIETLAKSFRAQKAVAPEPLSADELKEKSETTHFSILDSEGQGIAFTVTLNGTYGSAVVSPKFGVALNDEMDDFTTRPGQPNMYNLMQGSGNLVEPGKRPLSSMTPTLVEKAGKVQMVVGAPGGPRITSAVLQVLYRVLARGTDIDVAVQQPRVHHQFQPQEVWVEPDRTAPEVLDGLKARGHKLIESKGLAKVYVVRLRPDGILEGAYDSRGEGAAGGL